MNIDREIEEQQMKMKALYAEREMRNKGEVGSTLTPYGEAQCGPSRFSPEWVADVIRYHQPGPDGVLKISAVRLAVENLLRCIIDNCPDSADRWEAIRLARTAMMTANASIVLNGRG